MRALRYFRCFIRNVIIVVDRSHEFKGLGHSVFINDCVWRIWQNHRQNYSFDTESFGVLIGSASLNFKVVYVESITTPFSSDLQSRNSFSLRDVNHQLAVNTAHRNSNGSQIYLGTWHTHPEAIPSPSRIDTQDWRKCMKRNRKRPLLFVIVGTQQTNVFLPFCGWFRLLKQETDPRDE